jgi:hypothetical protein
MQRLTVQGDHEAGGEARAGARTSPSSALKEQGAHVVSCCTGSYQITENTPIKILHEEQ